MSSTRDPPLSKQSNIAKQPPPPPSVHDGLDSDFHQLVSDYQSKDFLTLLLVFRFLNALSVCTFFQPDEYFQSLEPAWQMAFGGESGAWITWEWHHQLRSSLHPAIFAGLYYLTEKPMEFLSFFPQFRALLHSVLPNILQGLIAAAGDYFTWRLAEKIYGRESNAAWSVLMMTIFSPWQWFCSTRTFSNCLETMLTIVALSFWPWEMAGGDEKNISREKSSPQPTPGIFSTSRAVNNLRISLLSAALACILRPTNILIWFCVAPLTLFPFLLQSNGPTRTKPADYFIVFREIFFCGSVVLAVSCLSDRLYFGEWTFPPYQMLTFNITRDVAVFYGSMPLHYYLSQGLPLLLTTYLPFTILGLFQSSSSSLPASAQNIRFILTATVVSMLAALSLIAHKEVRFIYPLLPILHILTAPTITNFFSKTETVTKFPPPFPSTPVSKKVTIGRRFYLKLALLATNLVIAYYTTRVHQSGVVSIMTFLREEYEHLALDVRGNLRSLNIDYGVPMEEWEKSDYEDGETFVGFLMPCHSTPWRSRLVYPGLKAWALGCEPPLSIPAHTPERLAYRDEADRFYDDPVRFLSEEINTREKPWPRYIAGFEGIESILREWYETEMKGFVMREKWRGFNSHWHDDSRRNGDVVVWEFVDGSKVI